jgi:hypothetical protein
MKLNKGLTSLNKAWKENKEILQGTEKETLEYAEAIGGLQKAFEEAYGFSPSYDFVTKHLD